MRDVWNRGTENVGTRQTSQILYTIKKETGGMMEVAVSGRSLDPGAGQSSGGEVAKIQHNTNSSTRES